MVIPIPPGRSTAMLKIHQRIVVLNIICFAIFLVLAGFVVMK